MEDEHLPHAEHMAEQMAAPQQDAIQEPTIDTDGSARKGIDKTPPIFSKYELFVE